MSSCATWQQTTHCMSSYTTWQWATCCMSSRATWQQATRCMSSRATWQHATHFLFPPLGTFRRSAPWVAGVILSASFPLEGAVLVPGCFDSVRHGMGTVCLGVQELGSWCLGQSLGCSVLVPCRLWWGFSSSFVVLLLCSSDHCVLPLHVL